MRKRKGRRLPIPSALPVAPEVPRILKLRRQGFTGQQIAEKLRQPISFVYEVFRHYDMGKGYHPTRKSKGYAHRTTKKKGRRRKLGKREKYNPIVDGKPVEVTQIDSVEFEVTIAGRTYGVITPLGSDDAINKAISKYHRDKRR